MPGLGFHHGSTFVAERILHRLLGTDALQLVRAGRQAFERDIPA